MGNGMGFNMGNGMGYGYGSGGTLLFMLFFLVALIGGVIFIKNYMFAAAGSPNIIYSGRTVGIIIGNCSNCGREVEQGWRVCPNCGKEVKTQNTYQNV